MPNATRIKQRITIQVDKVPTKSKQNHARAVMLSLIHLVRRPVTNLTAILIIAIALTLPTGFYVLLKNIRAISNNWDKSAQISLYLKSNLSAKKTEELLKQLEGNPSIKAIKYISPEDGLKEFQQTSGFSDILAELKQNPLPAVVLVEPQLLRQNEASIANLVATLKNLPEIASIQLDFEWVKRLSYFMNLGSHMLYAIFVLLSIGLVLIISNTISLTTHFALHKVTSSKNFSGERAFVHRVFLYKGIWFGLLGSLLTWLLVALFLWWLHDTVAALATTYGSNFALKNLSWRDGSILLTIGVVLGLGGAWLGILKHKHPAEN